MLERNLPRSLSSGFVSLNSSNIAILLSNDSAFWKLAETISGSWGSFFAHEIISIVAY